MTYHNGPLLTNNQFVQVIYYGNWDSSAQTIVNKFGTAMQTSNGYMDTVALTYSLLSLDSKHTYNQPWLIPSWDTNTNAPSTDGTYSKSLNDPQLQQLVVGAAKINGATLSNSGVYVIITAADVTQSISSSSAFYTQCM